MKTRKSKKYQMAFKVDLEKAYDRVRWDFLEDTVINEGFPNTIIKVIMHCVNLTTMQVLWNEIVTKPFCPTQWVRYEDPLSPYLFVLGMECLGHLIVRAVDNNDYKPLLLSRRSLGVSHIFFTDDLILFSKADSQGVEQINAILSVFWSYSRHKVNKQNTQIFFSFNTLEVVVVNVSDRLDFSRVDDLGKYLVISVFHKQISIDTFQFMVDKFVPCLMDGVFEDFRWWEELLFPIDAFLYTQLF